MYASERVSTDLKTLNMYKTMNPEPVYVKPGRYQSTYRHRCARFGTEVSLPLRLCHSGFDN